MNNMYRYEVAIVVEYGQIEAESGAVDQMKIPRCLRSECMIWSCRK